MVESLCKSCKLKLNCPIPDCDIDCTLMCILYDKEQIEVKSNEEKNISNGERINIRTENCCNNGSK